LAQKSLLPAGVKEVEGDFDLGDCVEILGPSRELVGRGITNYSSEELKKY
jgi:glutamate 5-kinase